MRVFSDALDGKWRAGMSEVYAADNPNRAAGPELWPGGNCTAFPGRFTIRMNIIATFSPTRNKPGQVQSGLSMGRGTQDRCPTGAGSGSASGDALRLTRSDIRGQRLRTSGLRNSQFFADGRREMGVRSGYIDSRYAGSHPACSEGSIVCRLEKRQRGQETSR
jgi:hypothetical protein